MNRLRSSISDALNHYWYISYTLNLIVCCPCPCVEGIRFCFDGGYCGSDMIDMPAPKQRTHPIPLMPRSSSLTLPLDGLITKQNTADNCNHCLFMIDGAIRSPNSNRIRSLRLNRQRARYFPTTPVVMNCEIRGRLPVVF
jgi:hypothetical protein